MVASNFDACLSQLLRHEGGYVNDPRDPGGETRFGISKRAYPHEDIKSITRERAAELYRIDYWNPIRGDDLPAGVDAVTFDAAANSGVSRAAKWLQGALGVTADGKIGPATLTAARAADPIITINRALDARLAFMKVAKNTKTGALLWPTYKNGWSRRIAEMRVFATHLAKGAKPTPSKPAVLPRPVDPTPPPAAAPGAAAVAAGLILALIAAVLIFGGMK